MHNEFYQWSGDTSTVDIGGAEQVTLPIFHYPHRYGAGIFSADLAEVADRLPSTDLHPARWGRGRAALLVYGAVYPAVDGPAHNGLTAYAEVGVMALVTWRHSAPPISPRLGVPASHALKLPQFGLQMPVTSRVKREIGRRGFGLSRFVADIRYEERTNHDRVIVAEDDELLFTLTFTTAGDGHHEEAAATLYSDLDDELLRTDMPCMGTQIITHGEGSAKLTLGDHRVSDELRSLGVDPVGSASLFIPDRRLILPPPRVVGPASRRNFSYPGPEREFGHMTVSHTPAEHIDLSHVQQMPTLRLNR